MTIWVPSSSATCRFFSSSSAKWRLILRPAGECDSGRESVADRSRTLSGEPRGRWRLAHAGRRCYDAAMPNIGPRRSFCCSVSPCSSSEPSGCPRSVARSVPACASSRTPSPETRRSRPRRPSCRRRRRTQPTQPTARSPRRDETRAPSPRTARRPPRPPAAPGPRRGGVSRRAPRRAAPADLRLPRRGRRRLRRRLRAAHAHHPLADADRCRREHRQLITLGIGEPFLTSLWVSIYFGLVLALPVILWQVWPFFVPAVDRAHAADDAGVRLPRRGAARSPASCSATSSCCPRRCTSSRLRQLDLQPADPGAAVPHVLHARASSRWRWSSSCRSSSSG